MSVSSGTPSAAWYLGATPEVVSQWLARLRWTSVGIDALVVLTSFLLAPVTFPLRRLVPLIAAAGLASAEMARKTSRLDHSPRMIRGVSIAIDVVLLTGLLELSGGPSNAFSVVYVLLVALTAVTLGRTWAAFMGTWALLCYGVLISWHLEELVPAHHRLADFPTHLFMLWLTIAALAELAGHFVCEASAALARREAQLEDMRQRAVRSEHLMSLTTLAAGAAHELSTPLATIAVASRELERALATGPGPAERTVDARLIRQEVDRCQLILDQMSGRAGGSAAEPAAPATIDDVMADVVARLSTDQVDRLHIRVKDGLPGIVVPRANLVQVILSLLKNAFDATDASKRVGLDVSATARTLRFQIEDEGPGMPPDVLRRAGEPFFTTKEPGRGIGLGLFLARMFAERCGGSLSLRSERGTVVALELPLTSRAEVA